MEQTLSDDGATWLMKLIFPAETLSAPIPGTYTCLAEELPLLTAQFDLCIRGLTPDGTACNSK